MMFVLHFNSLFNRQVYGQCKAVMYMNRVHRVTRLYKYSCTVRPGNNQSLASCFYLNIKCLHMLFYHAHALSWQCLPLKSENGAQIALYSSLWIMKQP